MKNLLHLRLNPEEVEIIEGFTRDMRGIRPFGTGDLEITIRKVEDFEKAKSLIDKVYEIN